MVTLRHVAPGITAAALLTLAASCSSSEEPAPSAAPPSVTSSAVPQKRPAPVTFEVAPDLPPVPGIIYTGARPAEVVRAAYLFVAQHPEVMSYMPCFCGCERMGHRGNEDCFVSRRDAAGRPREWETHGLICEVCLDVATRARQMHNSGASVSAIRAAIEQAYAGSAGHTPTPMPKKGTHE